MRIPASKSQAELTTLLSNCVRGYQEEAKAYIKEVQSLAALKSLVKKLGYGRLNEVHILSKDSWKFRTSRSEDLSGDCRIVLYIPSTGEYHVTYRGDYASSIRDYKEVVG